MEVALFELGEAEVELNRGELGIDSQGLLVGGSGFGIFLFFGKNDTQTSESRSIVRIARGHSAPRGGSFRQLPLLLERNGIRRGRRLGNGPDRYQDWQEQRGLGPGCPRRPAGLGLDGGRLVLVAEQVHGALDQRAHRRRHRGRPPAARSRP